MADPYGSNITEAEANNAELASYSMKKLKLANRVKTLRTDVDEINAVMAALFVNIQADMGALSDSTGGSTPDGTLGPIGATNSGDESGAINDNFRDLLTKVNAIRDTLRSFGLMS